MKGYIEVKGTVITGWSNNARRSNLDGNTKKIKVNFDNVVIPDGITHIQESPFGCLCEVKKLTMPKSVKSISRRFFESTTATELYYSGTLEEWSDIEKPRGVEYSLTCGYIIHALDGVKDYR